MLNYKLISKLLGTIAFCEAMLLFGCSVMGFVYFEDDTISFIQSTFIALAVALLLQYLGRNAQKVMNRRDGYIVVGTGWLLATVLGMFPYLLDPTVKGVANAFFESMSGFTSTGSTIMDNIDTAPHALLFWRALTQWIGGLGIVIFTLALLPGINMGTVQAFASQCTGPLQGKLQPRVSTTAKWITGVYTFLTVACALSLIFFGGMNWFDGVCHSFTCVGTGGFSTRQDSIAFFNSPVIEYILIGFMFLAGMNYNLIYFFALRGKLKRLFADTEFKWYVMIFVCVTLVAASTLFFYNRLDVENSLRSAAFQTITTMTSTGFCSHDYMTWVPQIMPLMFLVMVIGGCSGSSAGGFKVVRVAMVHKVVRNEMKKAIHPNAVIPLKINRQTIPTPVKIMLLCFTGLFTATFFVGWISLMMCGLPFEEAAICSLSTLSNAGPAFGSLGPAYSWNHLSAGAKWIASALMFVGRLELVSVFIVFTRNFWKRH